MANWGGTFTITTPGTTASGGTSTTLTNLSASWPTGAQSLANFTVRLLSGTGAGQERVITSNTSTVLTVPTWTTTPDATSTYEIVLILKNNDHITSTLSISTNVITELEDSATILVDGLYQIVCTTSSTVRWNKSETTLVTFEANNRAVVGKAGFWSYISFSGKTVSAPECSYIRCRDCSHAPLVVPTTAMGDGSTVHHIWVDCSSLSMAYMLGTCVIDMKLRSYYCENSQGSAIYFATGASAFTQIAERMWVERSLVGGPAWATGAATNALSWIRDNVFAGQYTNRNVDAGSGRTQRSSGNYFVMQGASGSIIMGATTAGAAGSYEAFHNVNVGGRALYAANVVSSATLNSTSNDITAENQNNNYGIDISNAASYTSATSDFDFIAGNLLAAIDNVDTTAGTSSSASPAQYRNLTSARTNARSTKNFQLTVDNVVVGTPTSNAVTVTFDGINGALSGQTTTVNSDSSSGQPVLNVVSSESFRVGMMAEVGYGTARVESARISALGAGTITLDTDLIYTHTAAQADVIAPQLRHMGLPFIRYGTATNDYKMQTAIPERSVWGLIYTGIKTIFDGKTYAFNRLGHSVTIEGLEPDVIYYAQACFMTPHGLVGESTEFSFTTAGTANYSDPGEPNVRLGTAYKFASPTNNKTGTARIPTVGNVKIGYLYDDADSLTGTYDGSDRWTDPAESNVRLSIAYKANSTTNNKTGNARIPPIAQVKIGTIYDSSDSLTGTYDGSERYTDLNQANVLTGITSRYNTTGSDNRTGTLISPTVAQIWSEDLTSYATTGTAGFLLRLVYAFTKFTNLFAKSKI
jgi:hypothetical protein